MDANTNHPTSIRSAVGGYLRALIQHGWMILTFRHRGEGLSNISSGHLIVLISLGLWAMWYLPCLALDSEFPSRGMVVIGMATVAVSRFHFGIAATAGVALVMLIAEPVSVLLRLVDSDVAVSVDLGLRFWCLAANMAFLWC